MPFQNDLQNRCSEFKLILQNINVKKQWSECICRSILRNSFFMTRRSSILPWVRFQSLSITRYLRIDKNNTLIIFMLSGFIQFYSSVLVKSNHAILLNNTFKSFWMINVNTTHILISYSIIYGSLIIPNTHFHMQ